MVELLETFANNLLPILLISGCGYLIGKYLHLDSRTVGRITFYIFSPALVFTLLTKSQLSYEKIGLMMGFAAAVIALSGGSAYLVGRVMRFERPVLMAILLTTMFANTGNYGLPLISFAYGNEALAYASVYFVTNSLLLNTAGVLIASMGHMPFKQAVSGLLKVPGVYAIALAMLLIRTGWEIPVLFERTTSLLANAAIPTMLVLLGMELQKATWNKNLWALTVSNVMRLLTGPAISLGLAALFGLSGATRQAGVMEASMPSAVLATVLASEYNLEPALVTATVFSSTLLSPFTLTPLLVYLGS